MATYVALIGGINGAGQKPVSMAELKKLFEAQGLTQVQTYIQSGNVLFIAPKRPPADLASQVEKALEAKFSLQAKVLVRLMEDLARILDDNPFQKRKLGEGERLYISFLSAPPQPEKAADLAKLDRAVIGADECELQGSEVYLLCRTGYGKTALSNAFIEKTLGVSSTTRNLETTKKLFDLGLAI